MSSEKGSHFSSCLAAVVMSVFLWPSSLGSPAISSQAMPYARGFFSMRTKRYVYDSQVQASFTFVTVPANRSADELHCQAIGQGVHRQQTHCCEWSCAVRWQASRV